MALAAGYSAVYPRASPGGWQLIGRTEQPMWDLAAGPAGAGHVPASGCGSWSAPHDPRSSRSSRPVRSRPSRTSGRPGRAAWGVGRSGAADRASAALANRLVANPASAAVLEVTLGGLSLRAHVALTMALTGADARGSVGGRPVAWGAPFAVPAGAVLALGTPATGLRTYLGVRGGIDVPPVLGSRSYDVLARLGPRPLAAGDRLPVGPEPHGWPDVDVAPARRRAVAAEPDGAVRADRLGRPP